MNLNEQVVLALQESVKTHWTAIYFYQTASEQFARWGYSKLAERFSADVTEESEHLSSLIKRLEFGDVSPELPAEFISPARHDVLAVLKQALEMENKAATIERVGIETACEVTDNGTVQVFQKNLRGSEASILDLEAQIKIFGEIGQQNYLANQV